MGGWVGGWRDEWMDGRAGLRIAHSNQKIKIVVLNLNCATFEQRAL